MPSNEQRKYDLIVLGATGHTGKLCAEYITRSLPTTLKWALAGRSQSKLSDLLDELKGFNPDRFQPGKSMILSCTSKNTYSKPGIEISTLDPQDLHTLARKTKVLINTVGPYHLYSSPVVEACAKNGTHYLDATGESPWVLEMITKYHETAKANHAIIIPEIAVESAPSDILAFALTQLIRKELSVGTREVVACMHELKSTPSGGTVATALGLLDHYSLKEVAKSAGTWASSPVPRTGPEDGPSLISKLFGVRKVPGLGTLTTSLAASPNIATVQRSWGLLDGGKLYGPNFTYHEYLGVRNTAIAVAVHFAFVFVSLAAAIPPLRWLAKRYYYAFGSSPSQDTSNEALEFRAIATADQRGPHPRRAFATFRWEGSVYYFTGVCLAEAAMLILNDGDLVQRLDGGILTPATLGQAFIDRMVRAGVKFEVEMLPES